MLFVRIAHDQAGKDEERAALLEAHKAHLRSGMAKIIQSGPLFNPDGRKYGALIIF